MWNNRKLGLLFENGISEWDHYLSIIIKIIPEYDDDNVSLKMIELSHFRNIKIKKMVFQKEQTKSHLSMFNNWSIKSLEFHILMLNIEWQKQQKLECCFI